MRTVLSLVLATLASPLWAQNPVQVAETALLKRLESRDTGQQRVRLLLSRARGSASPVTKAVERLLAREPVPLLLETARSGSNARHRSTAAAALLHTGRVREALSAVMADRSPRPVRHLTVRLASRGHTGPIVDLLARYLRSPEQKTRIRTAEALADLGDSSAVPTLVRALRSYGQKPGARRSVRAHVSFTTQTAVVRDFNVEIA